MRDNHTILERNIMHALDDEEACAMFLRLVDRCGTLLAERAAYEWRDLGGFTRKLLDLTSRAHQDHGLSGRTDGVFEFIRERQYRRYAPGN